MEQHLGRKLRKDEQVHHINENPLDNRIENLTVLSPKEHMSLHKQRYPDKKICVECGAQYQPNPRKRKRQKCCSVKCAMVMRISGRKRQVAQKIGEMILRPDHHQGSRRGI